MFSSVQPRVELQRLIAEHNPDLMLTLNLHRALDLWKFQGLLDHFMNRVQRRVDGGKWARIPPDDRPSAIGMVEHLEKNPHAHVAFYGPERFVSFALTDAAKAEWRACHEHCGQLHAVKTWDPAGQAAYMLKDFRGGNGGDRLLIYAPTSRKGAL